MRAEAAVRLSLFLIFTLTAWRVIWLSFDGTDLFVDESQYWLWGQHLDFGYYSKPPFIGWLIRAVTDLAGSDAEFWVRLPSPILQAVTALLIIRLGADLSGARVGALAGALYVSLPFVSVGSALISTDTVMLPFFTGALILYFRELKRPALPRAIAMGALVGLGMMGKYAAVYFALGALLAALLNREARLKPSHALAASLAALLMLAPNIWWNLAHDATTVRHTLDNADWSAEGLNWSGAAEFFASQFAVFGPILFGALLLLAWRSPRAPLVLFSLPIVALMVWQGLMSKAYANWAVTAYVAGTVAVAALLVERRWLIRATLALHLALALALPVLKAHPYAIGGVERPLLARYLGHDAISTRSAEVAARRGVRVIVAQNRDLLANLFYRLDGQDLTLYALPRAGFEGSYYEQKFPVPRPLTQDALYLSNDRAAPCTNAQEVERWRLPHRKRALTLHLLPAGCL